MENCDTDKVLVLNQQQQHRNLLRIIDCTGGKSMEHNSIAQYTLTLFDEVSHYGLLAYDRALQPRRWKQCHPWTMLHKPARLKQVATTQKSTTGTGFIILISHVSAAKRSALKSGYNGTAMDRKFFPLHAGSVSCRYLKSGCSGIHILRTVKIFR
jgi:hypothetical protein